MNNRKLGALFVFLGTISIVGTFFMFEANAFAYVIPFGGLVLGAAYAWLGLLLRKQVPLARFFALGPCLLMTIGAWLMPVFLLVAWAVGSSMAELGEPSGLFSWSRTAAAVALFLTFIYCVVMGVLGYRGLKYLRSAEGREDFRDKSQFRPAEPPFESRWVVVGSAVVAIVVVGFLISFDFNIRAAYLPDFLKTREMTRLEDRLARRSEEGRREWEVQQARVYITATYFAGSRHVVLLVAGKPHRVFALDLDSGKLRRTAAPDGWRATIEDSVVASDASMIVSGKTALSLITGRARRLESIQPSRLIGIPAPDRLLAYNETSQKLELVDVERDTVIYSIDVPVADRGDPYGGRNPGGWTHHSQTWNLDRSRFIWLTVDGTINDLDVATGLVTRTRCADCRYGSFQHLSAAEDVMMFTGNSVVPETEARTFPAPVYHMASHRLDSVQHRDLPIAIGKGGRSTLSQFHQSDRLFHYDYSSVPPRRLALVVPDGARVFAARGTRPLVLASLHERRARVMITDLESPEPGKAVRFIKPPLALNYVDRQQVSPDGRFMFHMEGNMIEVVDLHAAARGEPANRIMNVLEEDELKTATPMSAAEAPFVSRWQKVEQPTAVGAQ
jgi:hypothetical protein